MKWLYFFEKKGIPLEFHGIKLLKSWEGVLRNNRNNPLRHIGTNIEKSHMIRYQSIKTTLQREIIRKLRCDNSHHSELLTRLDEKGLYMGSFYIKQNNGPIFLWTSLLNEEFPFEFISIRSSNFWHMGIGLVFPIA